MKRIQIKDRDGLRRYIPLVYLLAVLILYGALLLPTLGRQGISWDEQVDLWIAMRYLEPAGWVKGSDIDPSQARLPMAFSALVYLFTGKHDLVTARLASAVVGGMTLVGVYAFASRRFSRIHGLAAAGLLAVSPFYLSFARVGFTETDIYLACALVWLLAAIDRLQEKPTIGWAAAAGIVLGLAAAAKFTAFLFFPVLLIYLWRHESGDPENQVPRAVILFWSGWLAAGSLAILDFSVRISAENYSDSIRLFIFWLTLLTWVIPLGWAARNRNLFGERHALAIFAAAMGLLTFFLAPPEHLTNIGHLINPELSNSILWRIENELTFNLNFAGEAAALHLLSVLFKSSPVLGLGMILGWLAAISEWNKMGIRMLLLFSGSYFAGLLILPIAQTFYMIPILPLLSILAVDGFLRLYRKRRTLAIVLALVGTVWCGIELTQSYPDYNLNGYQWLGARPLLGRSSIGYRSVVQTPSDGVEQAVDWLNSHADKGDRVLVYALPWHIIRETAGEADYILVNGMTNPFSAKADYIVVSINAIVWQGWHLDTPENGVVRYPYDPVELGRDYEKVFSVQRAFGLEVASVWKRK